MELLSSSYPWHLALGEQPRPPAALPQPHDTVRVGLALGLHAIDGLIADGASVGPLRYCLAHHRLLVPVESGTADRWQAPHSECALGPRLRCISEGYGGCTGLWVTRPHPDSAPTTSADALYDALSRTRSRRHASDRWPGGPAVTTCASLCSSSRCSP
jgi:hypothetical protein